MSTSPRVGRFALALGGGAARGLAHIGVLDVLEREGLRPESIVGTSMGSIIGALYASGAAPPRMMQLARTFHFPRTFVPGGLLRWTQIFGACVPELRGTFEQLPRRLLVTAVNIESGHQVIVSRGSLLPAVRASSCVPGVMSPVRLGPDWLMDGGLVNVLPVDVAWVTNPDFVVAVDVGGSRSRTLPFLGWPSTHLAERLGELVPNPATAKVSLELLVRASEILLDRQSTLATAMTNPDVVIRPSLEGIGLRDFGRLHEVVEAGRRAAEEALPELRRRLREAENAAPRAPAGRFYFDPVCAMLITPSKSRGSVEHDGTVYHFCSTNCRESFERRPEAFMAGGA